MSNTSAFGNKFVFSKFLQPVSESKMEEDIKNIDAWLEADDAKIDAQQQKEAEKQAEELAKEKDENNKEVTESVENLIVKLESLNIEDTDLVNEFKSDVAAYYSQKRDAEKISGGHDNEFYKDAAKRNARMTNAGRSGGGKAHTMEDKKARDRENEYKQTKGGSVVGSKKERDPELKNKNDRKREEKKAE